MASPATDNLTVKPARKRRWLQFGLSTLLILVTLSAVVLALIVNPAQRQRRAVAFVEDLGGSVVYDEPRGMASAAPEWLRERVGEHYFRTLIGVYLGNTPVSDAGLEHLKGLTGLHDLDLSNTPVSNAGLAHLEGLTGLLGLDLGGTQVSDAGLAHLKGFTALQYLYLEGAQVTDAGVAELKAALPSCAVYGP